MFICFRSFFSIAPLVIWQRGTPFFLKKWNQFLGTWTCGECCRLKCQSSRHVTNTTTSIWHDFEITWQSQIVHTVRSTQYVWDFPVISKSCQLEVVRHTTYYVLRTTYYWHVLYMYRHVQCTVINVGAFLRDHGISGLLFRFTRLEMCDICSCAHCAAECCGAKEQNQITLFFFSLCSISPVYEGTCIPGIEYVDA